MAKRRSFVFLICIICLFSAYLFWPHAAKESILYFPIDEGTTFSLSSTTLEKKAAVSANRMILRWSVQSILEKNAHLRQDIGLVFANGRLYSTIGEKTWKKDTSSLFQAKDLTVQESTLLQAVSFHYGELHEGSSFKSAQSMSAATRYAVLSKFSPPITFSVPKSRAEKEWQNTLTAYTDDRLQAVWQKGKAQYKLDVPGLSAIPLTEIAAWQTKSLPGLDRARTQKVIGQLWEGLYKNYVLGIKNGNSPPETPIGSYVPLILINRQAAMLYVLIPDRHLQFVLLKQKIS